MQIQIHSRLSPLAAANEYDARGLAHALTALGYYTPDPQTGIVRFDPDRRFFDAIRKFQMDHGLFPGAFLYPGDETELAINAALGRLKTDGHFYLWRTVGDDKVRGAHAQRNHRLFRWSEDLPGGHPGEDYNCRCWAEPYMRTYAPPVQGRMATENQSNPSKSEESRIDSFGQMLIKHFENQKRKLSAKLLRHYLEKSGLPVILTTAEINKSAVLYQAMQTNKMRFEDSFLTGAFKKQILNIKDGTRIILNKSTAPGGNDYWERDIKTNDFFISDDQDYATALGHVTLKSTGSFQAVKIGYIVTIEGVVDHTINDLYNYNPESLNPVFIYLRNSAKTGKAKEFSVHGSKLEKLTATIKIENGIIKNSKFEWSDVP